MKKFRAHPTSTTALLSIGVLGILSACSSQGGFPTNAEAPAALRSSELRIESVSTRPYLVTGGDVLLRIVGGENLDLSGVRVAANGIDVTEQFRPVAHSRPLLPPHTSPSSAGSWHSPSASGHARPSSQSSIIWLPSQSTSSQSGRPFSLQSALSSVKGGSWQ